MTKSPPVTARETKIASVLRPLGTAPMTRNQAVLAGELLRIHWGHVYRLRRRFLENPVASSVSFRSHGQKPGNRIDRQAESIVQAALHFWMPRQRQLAHPLLDLCKEIGKHCKAPKVKAPSRNTIASRWASYRDEQAALLAKDPRAAIAPGNFNSKGALGIVQIDHTQADVFVVDPWFRRALGRPWLTLAIDIASSCVVGFYLAAVHPPAELAVLAGAAERP